MERQDSRRRSGEIQAKLRVVLADDHPDLLEGMSTLLASDCEVVSAVRDGVSLIDAAREARPDIIITDINMPGLNGIDAGRRILEQGLCGAVVIHSVYNELPLVRQAMDAGIRGFVLKTDAGEEMMDAVKSVLAGNSYLSRGVSMTRPGR